MVFSALLHFDKFRLMLISSDAFDLTFFRKIIFILIDLVYILLIEFRYLHKLLLIEFRYVHKQSLCYGMNSPFFQPKSQLFLRCKCFATKCVHFDQ